MALSFFRRRRGQPVDHRDINDLQDAALSLDATRLQDVGLTYPDSGSAALVSLTGNVLTRSLRLATNALSGLLAATDKAKIDLTAFGPNGELLLGPDFTSFVGQKTGSGATADAHLRAGGRYVFSEAPSNNHMASNAYFDGTNWNRYNTGAPAIMWDVIAASQAIVFYSAPAGANPIAWNAIGELDAVGGLMQWKGGAATTQSIFSGLYSYLAGNIYYDGVNWNLYDTANSGSLWRVGPDGQMVIWTASAGANPRTLTSVGAFLPATLGLAMNPPRSQARAGSNSPAHATWTPAPPWSAVDVNTGGFAGGSPFVGSTSVYTVPVTGWYHFEFSGYWNSSTAGAMRGLRFWVNASVEAGAHFHPPATLGNLTYVTTSFDSMFTAGDTVVPQVYQDTGINFPFTNRYFTARYLGTN